MLYIYGVSLISFSLCACNNTMAQKVNLKDSEAKSLNILIDSNQSGHSLKDVLLREGIIFEMGNDVIYNRNQREVIFIGPSGAKKYFDLFLKSLDNGGVEEILKKWKNQDIGIN